jgi:nucleotide-binding universal stress UspA family protein
MTIMLQHILIPLDGSELAEIALEQAQRIIEPGGQITLLLAVDPPEQLAFATHGAHPIAHGGMVENPLVDYSAIADNMLSQGKDYLRSRAETLEKAGYRVSTRAEFGFAADLIVEAAEKAQVDAIVMSTHGRSGITRWLLGSVTSKVLSAASCPVFVIPKPKKD